MQIVLNLVRPTRSSSARTADASRSPAASTRPRGLSIAVTDTGIGIATDDIGRVLEAFEQVDSSLSRKQQGTGLGLPLVRAMMELHGGRFELNSTVGVGTEAKVTFPADRLVFSPASNAVGIAA